MKRRVFIHQSPKKPVGAQFLVVKHLRKDGEARLTPGAAFEWDKRSYYVGKGGELRRIG